MNPHRPFRPGERVLLVDSKARRYLITLVEGGSFSTHAGTLPHAELIGHDEGILVRTSHGARLRAVRPTLRDYILKMPRGAQVIYPKDIGPILVLADIFPGARLLEAGVGSGALSMALLRAVGPKAPSPATRSARTSLPGRSRTSSRSSGPASPTASRSVTSTRASMKTGLDRIVLDLPEPWRVVKHATHALRPGGILVSYLPTVGQVARLREELDGSPFGWPKPSRCSSGRGTSKGSRSGPTTGWWRTPGSSPLPGCSTPSLPGVGGVPGMTA